MQVLKLFTSFHLLFLSVNGFSNSLDYKYKFDKFMQFLQIFTCTTYFIHDNIQMPDSNYNFDYMCKGMCVNVQISTPFLNIFRGKFIARLNINLFNKNVSYDMEIFTSKYRFLCNAEFFLIRPTDVLNYLAYDINLSLVLNSEYHRFPQPDYILLLINFKRFHSSKLVLKATFITRSNIILLNIHTAGLYFACTAKSSTKAVTERNPWNFDERSIILFSLYVPLLQLDETVVNGKTYDNLVTILNQFSFQMTRNLPANVCPIETSRTSPFYYSSSWISCLNILFQTKINCSSRICDLHMKHFTSLRHERISVKEFPISYAIEFYGPVYSLFYLKADVRNIFSFLSPFTFIGWVVVVVNCYFVGFMLWYLNIRFNPFFWLFTVVLEQNDDLMGKVSKSSLPVVLAWLYFALVLRQAYTSNLYGYMTFEKPPSGLPLSLKEFLMSDSAVIMASDPALDSINFYRSGLDKSDEASGIRNNAKHLAQLIVKRRWYLKYSKTSGPFFHFRTNSQGNYQICDVKGRHQRNYIEDTCANIDKFAYMTVSGPAHNYKTEFQFYTGKLLLTVTTLGVGIVENKDNRFFQSPQFFISLTDNYLKLNFEKHLAYFVEGGINMFYNRYKIEKAIKEDVIHQAKYLVQNTEFLGSQHTSNGILRSYVSHWIKNNCFFFYLKDKCDLKGFETIEAPVAIGDLLAVWVLLKVLLVFSISSIVLELI